MNVNLSLQAMPFPDLLPALEDGRVDAFEATGILEEPGERRLEGGDSVRARP